MKHLNILTSLVFLLFLFGCKEDTIEPDLFGSLTGEVIFENTGLPAVGATISTIPATGSMLTDGTGKFEFESIKTGSYSVKAEFDGYVTGSENITILEGKTSNVIFKLIEKTGGNSPPSPAASPSPNDGSLNQSLRVNLSWQASDPDEDELKFDVYLFDADMSNDSIVGEGLSEPMLELNDLRYGTVYYWQVVVKDGEADPVYSPVWKFTTSPFPNHSFVYSKIKNGVFEIYSGDMANEAYQLTSGGSNYRPRFSPLGNRIAYINANYPEKRLFTMNRDGSDVSLVETAFPIDSKDDFELDFTWSPDGTKLLYMRGERLYLVNIDGSGIEEFAELTNGEEFVEVDWNGPESLIAARTVGNRPYDSRILLYDENGNMVEEAVPDVPGSIGGPQFSIDGKYLLYTRDTSGFEAADGRQLASHIFLRNIATGIEIDLSVDKPLGFNDLDARFSPDGALIIFVQTNNFPNSQKDIYVMNMNGEGRLKLFDNAEMPDWWD
ncbi:MAG TPA: hypothetical protein ENJ95_01085 [Bacteroidetes bacterium]|nr:hypothetical protein [Bacteroidota bacterium]